MLNNDLEVLFWLTSPSFFQFGVTIFCDQPVQSDDFSGLADFSIAYRKPDCFGGHSMQRPWKLFEGIY